MMRHQRPANFGSKKLRTGYARGGAVDTQYANVEPGDKDTVKPGTAAEWTPEAYQASLREQQAQGYAGGGAVVTEKLTTKEDPRIRASVPSADSFYGSLDPYYTWRDKSHSNRDPGYADGGAVRQNFRRGGVASLAALEEKLRGGWGLSAEEDDALRTGRQAQAQAQTDAGANTVSDPGVVQGYNAGNPGDPASVRALAGTIGAGGYAQGGAVRRIGYADGGTVEDNQGTLEYQRQLELQQQGQRQRDIEAQRQAEIERQAGGTQQTQLQPQTEAARQSELTAQAEEQKQAQTSAENQRQAQAGAQQPQGAKTPWYRQVYDRLVSDLGSATTAVEGAAGQLATGFKQGLQGDTSDIRYTRPLDAEGNLRPNPFSGLPWITGPNAAAAFTGEGVNPYSKSDRLFDQPVGDVVSKAGDAIHNFLWGEGAHTSEQLTQLQEAHPTKDLNKALQDAMTKAELAGDHAAGAQVLQTARKAYDLPRGYAAAAFDKGDADNGLVAWQRGFNQIPNNQQMDIAKSPDGRYMVKLTPEKAGQGEVKEHWLSPSELRKVQEAATFDNVVQHGLPAIIDSIQGKGQLTLPEPGATATIGPDGRPVYRATYDMTGMRRPGAEPTDLGFLGLKSVTDLGGMDVTREAGGAKQSQSWDSKGGGSSSSESHSDTGYARRPPSYWENPAYAASLTELPRVHGATRPAGFPAPGNLPQPIGPQAPPGFTPPAPQRDVFETMRTPGGLQRPQEYTREEAIRYNAQLAQQQDQFRSPRAGDTAYEARNRQLDQRSGYAAAQDAARAAERQQAVTGRTAEVARTNEINRRIQAGEPVGLGHSEQSRPDIPLPPRQAPTPESMVEAKRARSWAGQPYTAAEQAVDLKQARELELIRGRSEAPVAVAGLRGQSAEKVAETRGQVDLAKTGMQQTGLTQRADQRDAFKRENLDFMKSDAANKLMQKYGTARDHEIMRTVQTKITQGQDLSDDEKAVHQGLLDAARREGVPVPGGAPAAAPGGAQIGHIPPQAVADLKADPRLRQQFELKFGPGTAAAVLGR